ncbi:MAG: hypothetical protein EXX96DRAFT_486152 [Benjaminiella poitrasii]|nr:MAG: hypothetical protein EXX96DRAFT_486152 [Benjaminiella poitrasii]
MLTFPAHTRSTVSTCTNASSFLPLFKDPLSFLLNLLPTTKPRHSFEASSWFARWSIICIILHELVHVFHHKLPPPLSHSGRQFLTWLSCD